LTPRPEVAFWLEFHGPLLMVEFDLSEEAEWHRTAIGRPHPPAVPLLAILDTGANISGVREGTFRALDVRPTARMTFRTADRGGISAPAFLGRFRFPGGVEIPATVGEFQFPSSRIDCILGRDILGHGRFHYDGREGSAHLVLKGVEVPLPPPRPSP
jgi:hypothetical protein